MNKSNISKLNNKYDITIDEPTIRNFSGDWLRMEFAIYLPPVEAGLNRCSFVRVLANEPIYKAIEKKLALLGK